MWQNHFGCIQIYSLGDRVYLAYFLVSLSINGYFILINNREKTTCNFSNIVWLIEHVVKEQTGGEGSPHLPPMCDGHNWAADFFCWTFKLSTVKEINLFLPARVSSIFLSPAFCLPFLFMTLSPLFQCLCWLSLVLSPPPPPVSPFPSPLSLYTKGRFRGHQLLREGWESCMGSALGAAMLHYHQGDCRYAAATGCRHNNHNLSPSTGPYRLS